MKLKPQNLRKRPKSPKEGCGACREPIGMKPSGLALRIRDGWPGYDQLCPGHQRLLTPTR